jgi:hypothetical protein
MEYRSGVYVLNSLALEGGHAVAVHARAIAHIH